MALDVFLNDEDAFMDKKIYKLKYLPPKLQGAFVLKPKFDTQLKKVEFNVGTAVRV